MALIEAKECFLRRREGTQEGERGGLVPCPPSLRSLVLAVADDELVIGHRHSEWTGFAPHLEEDVAFSSIAQDEIGHAAALYGLLARLDDTDADAIALGRDAGEYRSAILCERPNRDW